MAQTTGIGWTDATVNFVIGCTKVGPGCDACYAAEFALQKWNIVFEAGGRRHVTQSGFQDPPRWQRKHDAGIVEKFHGGKTIKTPVWVFACSLSDFFDKEWPAEVRARAWAVIKACSSLRWQIVTKRVGLVERYLPDDWNGGKGYEHVGIIATMVNQEEVDRDGPKLIRLKTEFGVYWIGVSLEPQIGEIDPTELGGTMTVRLPRNPAPPIQPLTSDDSIGHSVAALGGSFIPNNDGIDWLITGGESKQGEGTPRPYHLEWARSLIDFGRAANIPVFVKQMGDNPHEYGGYTKRFGKNGGGDISLWPGDLRVQEMPRIYNASSPVPKKRSSESSDLFGGAA
jgi:protein gp37